MSSPEPSAVARMITLAPMTFLKGTSSGRSLDSTAGRYLSGMFQPSAAGASRSVTSAISIVLSSQACSPVSLRHVIEAPTSCQYGMVPGANPLPGPEGGEGNRFIYARTPWGLTVELISYPAPMAYERHNDARRRWRPMPTER